MIQKKRTFWIVVDCLKWGLNLVVFKTAIYGKDSTVFFLSFEQCISYHPLSTITLRAFMHIIRHYSRAPLNKMKIL